MNNSCILAPIHQPDFNAYGLDFIRTYNNFFKDDHIFLVFSNEKESNLFKSIAGDLKYKSIVSTEQMGEGPITQKKFFGLKYIFENTSFDKVGVIDVDTVFLKYIDYDKCFEDYIKNKKIYSGFGTHPHVKNIISSPLKFFGPEDKEKIKKVTHDLNAYFWFNDIPIYSKDNFLNFMKYINYENRINDLLPIDFDYIIYAYYLFVKDLAELELININGQIPSTPCSFIEQQHLSDPVFFEEAVKKYKPMWLKYDINQNAMENVFIRLHIHSPYK